MEEPENPSLPAPGLARPVLLIVAITLLLHLITNLMGGYGYFRDELYYLACTEHPGIGYVDQPPLSIWLLTLSRTLFGDSLFALRLFPAVAGAATVLLTALMARNMGGRSYAQSIAAVAAAVSPVFMGMDTIFSMNAFEILLVASAGYLVTRILSGSILRSWLLLGVVLGLGLLNKVSMMFFGFGLTIGLLSTDRRSLFRTPGPWLAAGTAAPFFLPYVGWNAAHHFPHLEFMRNASAGKYSGLTPLRFLSEQVLINNPFSIVLWISGLLFFFATRGGKPFRPLGFIFAGAATVLLLNGTSKAEYLAPAYTLLFAGGGVFLERSLARGMLLMLRRAVLLMVVAGIAVIPLGLPILPVETYLRYAAFVGITPQTSEQIELSELPQFYADMFGWEEQVRQVAAVFDSLPEEDHARCSIFAENYGRAGAVDFFGKRLGLPRAISGHNSYWLWGPGNCDGSLVLMLGREIGRMEELFEQVTDEGTVRSKYALPYENNLHIYLCRHLKIPVAELWQRLKHYE